MPLRFRITRRDPLFEVKISGLAFLGHAEDLLAQIGEATRREEASLLLIDALHVLGSIAPEDHAQLGYLLVRHLSHLRKVAMVVPAGKITGRSEAAAAERGLNLKVFASLQQAHDWLLD